MSMHFENHTNPVTGATSTVPTGKADMPKQSQAEDPPCVVGMACRVPGASNPSQLWDNIVNKKDFQRKMPADRFNVDAFYHPDGTHKGTVCSQKDSLRCYAKIYRQMPNMVTFWIKIWDCLTPDSSTFRGKKQRQWIPSSGSCWRLFMKLWRTVCHRFNRESSSN